MDQDKLIQLLSELLPDAVITQGNEFVELIIQADSLHASALVLKNNEQTRFDFLINQTGVDLNEELKVVYHLRSTQHNHACVVKVVTTDRENPAFDSVFDIWPAAEFHEREIYDLLGIKFTNHPDLRRLFLEDDFQGYPLRKDFVDNINMIEK